MFHVLSFLEMWLTLWLVTGQSLPVAAFILDTVGRLTNAFFKVIPLQLGVLQVGQTGRASDRPAARRRRAGLADSNGARTRVDGRWDW
jgi:hypothetical protein